MNWPRVEKEYPKSYIELRILNEMTGKLGADLLDEYIDFYNIKRGWLRLSALQEIEDSL